MAIPLDAPAGDGHAGDAAGDLRRTPFWFMRHGETNWNRDGLIQGSTDVPLNAAGRAQAVAAGQVLTGRGITAVWSSPMQRARDTASVVAAALGLEVVVEDGLREAGFGTQEGQVMGDWFTEWAAGRVNPDGGESFADLRTRAVAAMGVVLAGGGLPLVVAHGGFFRAVRQAMGFSAAVRTPNGVPVLCEPVPGALTLRAPVLGEPVFGGSQHGAGWTITPAGDAPAR
jgi:probable phosphoglycerate mutase